MKDQTRTLSHSLEHELKMYALAATGAGVSMLVLSRPAEAKIVYTRTDKSITPNHTIPLDLNHDGVTDFRLKDVHYTTTQFGFSHIGILSAVPAGHNEIVGSSKFGRHYASALQAGVSIGPKAAFKAGPRLMARVFSDTGAQRDLSSCSGPWSKAKNRYLGLRFTIKGEKHFGWARLNVSCPGTNVEGTLTGYAYETIPNKAIIAGKEKVTDNNPPKPASPGRLARGVVATPVERR